MGGCTTEVVADARAFPRAFMKDPGTRVRQRTPMGDRFARIRGEATDDWNDRMASDRVQSLIRNASRA
ncbi:hypothetical protein [Streptomyces sp. NPDC048295]|uniref:hypothetical protein n=1 Tax=Streptomyces sp. NPDC048295 TaxID=3154617 RepID=UPI00343FCEEC